MKKIYSKFWPEAWPILLIIAAVLIFFYPVWLKGLIPLPADLIVGAYLPWRDYLWGFETGVPVKNPIASDSISFIYPMRMLAIDLLKSGQLPLWNPYLFSGTPLLANFQSAPFSPTNFFYFITDKLSAWSLQIIFQHIFAATFTYLLLRYWKVSKISAVFGGLAYAFTGFNLFWSQWNAHALAAALFPLLLLFINRWIDTGKFRYGAGISVSFALQFFSGYPQLASYSLLAVFIFLSFFLKHKFFHLVGLLAFMILGLGIAAIQIIPAYELISLSQRSVETIPLSWVFLDWREIIGFLAPDYYGNHSTANYWGYKNYLSNIGFIGVSASIFALAGLTLLKESWQAKFSVLIIILSLLLAFPTPLSMLIWKNNFLGLQAGVSYRCLVLFSFGISLLCGFGLDRVLTGTKILKIIFVVPGLILGLFGAYAALYFLSDGNISLGILRDEELWKMKVALRNLVIPVFVFIALFAVIKLNQVKVFQKIIPVIALCLMGLELFYVGWKFTSFSPRSLVYPNTPVIDFLQKQEKPFRVNGYEVMPVNQGMPYFLEFPGGYDAVYPLLSAKYISVLNSQDSNSLPQDRFGIVDRISSPLLNLSNTKYLLVKAVSVPLIFKDNKAFSQDHKVVFEDKSVSIIENSAASPRAFFTTEWKLSEADNETLSELLSGNKDIVLVGEPLDFLSAKLTSEVIIKYSEYTTQYSKLNIETPKEGVLAVSETWYPGWKAYVDGIETNILRANYAYRAIKVPAGHHDIEFKYDPDSFQKGYKIMLVSIFVLLAVCAFKKIRGFVSR